MMNPTDARIVATMEAVRERLWVKTEVGGRRAVVNFLTHKQHDAAMKAMGMKPAKNHKGTHHLSVYLQDAKGNDVKPKKVLLRITNPKGKAATTPLKYIAAMTHYGADFDLGAKGSHKVVVMVLLDSGKQYQEAINYRVK